jgi:hypothetical protein
LIFMLIGKVMYDMQRKNLQHEISETALKIINKQLRSDINEYKHHDFRK